MILSNIDTYLGSIKWEIDFVDSMLHPTIGLFPAYITSTFKDHPKLVHVNLSGYFFPCLNFTPP